MKCPKCGAHIDKARVVLIVDVRCAFGPRIPGCVCATGTSVTCHGCGAAHVKPIASLGTGGTT